MYVDLKLYNKLVEILILNNFHTLQNMALTPYLTVPTQNFGVLILSLALIIEMYSTVRRDKKKARVCNQLKSCGFLCRHSKFKQNAELYI